MIEETYPFIKISSPTTDPFVDAWKISVSTNLLSDIKVYTATLKATLNNYPNATPKTLQFTVLIANPCDLTVLQPFALMPMSFTLGFVQTVTQPFPQFKDEVAERAANSKLCGERTYKLIDGHSFINLLIPVDPWISNI